jgi:pimeloyl-ACP methyl ester carboxylesterase
MATCRWVNRGVVSKLIRHHLSNSSELFDKVYRGKNKIMKIRYCFLIVLLMVSGLLSVSAQGDNFQLVDCPGEIPTGEIEGETFECGIITVPESRTGLSDGYVELALVVLYAKGEEILDPLIYLAGGPGNSGTAAAEGYMEHPMRDVMSLIFLDQRGTGYSYPSLDCWEEYMEDCYDRLVGEGITVDAYRSAENAADVNDVIEALELESVNLYGISYGTRLALTVMKDPHPAIRSAILDGVYPPNVQGYEEDAINIERAFNAVFEGCARDINCDGAYPDLGNVFRSMIEDLDNEPLILVYPNGDEEAIDGATVYDEIFAGLYSTDFVPYAPSIIYAAANRDGESLGDLLYSEDEGADEARAPSTRVVMGDVPENDGNSEGMFMAVDCADEAPFNDVEGIYDAVITIDLPDHWLEDTYDDMVEELTRCDAWDITPSDASVREATVSSIPSLLFNGEYDPVTPPNWGDVAASTLSNSYNYYIPAGGHGVLSISECTLDITYQFLTNPMTEPDASCIDSMPSVEWYTDYP